MPRKHKVAYNNYMRFYMREYRAAERELIRTAKKQLGWKTPKKRKRGK